MLKGSLGLIALSGLLLSGAAVAQEKIKVGVTATLEGTYTVLGEDGIRGHQTALNVLGKKVGDKELEFIMASTDACTSLRTAGPLQSLAGEASRAIDLDQSSPAASAEFCVLLSRYAMRGFDLNPERAWGTRP